MIAALPMYERPETAAAHDRLWALIHQNLGYGPDHLTRAANLWDIWQSPDLLLAQTCGLPFRARLHARVQLVGTPDYGLPDCPAGYYRSVLIVAANDPATTLEDTLKGKVAINEALSQSGWCALWNAAQDQGLSIPPVHVSGAHATSALWVAQGRARIAALDMLTWELIRAHDLDLANQLRVLDLTTPTPGLPLIAGPNADIAALRLAITQAIHDLRKDDRALLHLEKLVQIPAQAYLDQPLPPAPQIA